MRLVEAEAWLEGLINLERSPDPRRVRLSLEPVRALLSRAGDPQRGLRALHVAGSKGKGSVALLAEALLGAARKRTGTFTSPHLERWTERFRLDGVEVAGDVLAGAITTLRPHVEALLDGPEPPSFFDVTTAVAFRIFAEADVDVALVEVGLGGRLDSTNLVEPAVCCITSIELEHTDKLGDTLAAIAGEKAGIAKPGVPLVCGALPFEAASVVEARAHALGCPLLRLGRELEAESLEEDLFGSRLRFRDGSFRAELRLSAPGRHQVANAALALAAVRRLGLVGDAQLATIAEQALANVRLPARVEICSRAPWIVVDGAHTAASARALAETLRRIPRRRSHLVLSVSAGKDLAAICSALVPEADVVTVTRAESLRSLDPKLVAEAVKRARARAEVQVVPNPHLALRAARESLGPEDLLCASGSFYLAGIARRVLREPCASAESRTPGPAPRV
ncbi:MAG: bifunctional folylpolyglutamate synthase/dihydrofolate synthase [Myxococcota bacterium]